MNFEFGHRVSSYSQSQASTLGADSNHQHLENGGLFTKD